MSSVWPCFNLCCKWMSQDTRLANSSILPLQQTNFIKWYSCILINPAHWIWVNNFTKLPINLYCVKAQDGGFHSFQDWSKTPKRAVLVRQPPQQMLTIAIVKSFLCQLRLNSYKMRPYFRYFILSKHDLLDSIDRTSETFRVMDLLVLQSRNMKRNFHVLLNKIWNRN